MIPVIGYNFWRIISKHFAKTTTVAFYELFNEPADYNGQFGRMSWDKWNKTNEDLIKLLRAYDNHSLPLVAGFNWAYDLTPVNFAPIDA